MQALFSRPQSRLLARCRSTDVNKSATSVVDRKPEDEKITTTLNSLDAILGEQAKPQASTPSPSSPSAPSSKQPVYNWGSNAAGTPPAPAARPQQKKGDKDVFEKLMAFEGLAPEVINGRAAMLGFLFAMAGELGHGESVYAQIIGGGLVPFLGITALVTLASFAPGIRQVPWEEVFNKPKKEKDIKSFGPFTADAEKINGRWAMVGLAAIILLEGSGGTSFLLG